jgi:hypothetical protein
MQPKKKDALVPPVMAERKRPVSFENRVVVVISVLPLGMSLAACRPGVKQIPPKNLGISWEASSRVDGSVHAKGFKRGPENPSIAGARNRARTPAIGSRTTIRELVRVVGTRRRSRQRHGFLTPGRSAAIGWINWPLKNHDDSHEFLGRRLPTHVSCHPF